MRQAWKSFTTHHCVPLLWVKCNGQTAGILGSKAPTDFGVQVVLTYLNSPRCVVNKCHVVSQCQLAESSRLPAKCSRIGVNSSIIINNKSWSIIFINNNHDLGSTPFSLKRKPSFPHCNWGYFLGICLCPLKHPGTKLSKAILSRIVVTIVVTVVATVNNDNNGINQWYIYIYSSYMIVTIIVIPIVVNYNLIVLLSN